MVQESLFGSIFKYTPTKNKKPLENYCTEIFVYILKMLIKSNDQLSFFVLELFGFNGILQKDLKDIKILTQKKYSLKDRIVQPDIIISLRNKINIIEVKVNSAIRKYNIAKKQTINQMKLYKQIPNINEVFLLSKYTFIDDLIKNRNKVLWSQIHSILMDSENIIIKNFVLFLEENGMKSSIVKSGAESGINSIYALAELLQKSLESILTKKKYELKEEITWDYYGYYLRKVDKKENIAWIGQYREEMGEYIVFELLSKSIIKKAKNVKIEMEKINDGENLIFSKIPIKKITSCSKENKQQEIIQEWYSKEIEMIL